MTTLREGVVRDAVPQQARRPAFRPDIEGLRAVAVLLVVLSHVGVAWLPGGFVGVDVFFTISGFLITSLLLRELADTGRVSLGRFYARRAVRLLPASSLVLVLTLLACWSWLSPVRIASYAGDALASALYVSNIRFAVTGTDYFAEDSVPSPFQHFWSLAVEEQFYLCWPLMIILVAWCVRGRLRAVLGGVLLVVVVGSLALSIVETGRSATAAYFGVHTRAWEFGLGALLALGTGRLRRLRPVPAAALGWSGVAAIALAAVAYDGTTAFPGVAACLPVAGAAAVIAAGCAGSVRGPASLLSTEPMTAVGRWSYGWYLWHWPVLVIAPQALERAPGVPLKLLLAGGALAAAAASYRWLERPVRYRPALRDRPVRGLGLGFALSGAAAGAALLVAAAPPPIPTGRRAPDLPTVLARATSPADAMTALVSRGSDLTALPVNLVPVLERAAGGKTLPQLEGCHGTFTATAPSLACRYGPVGASTKVVLFGDSHALQWFPAMHRLAEQNRWQLISLTKSACPAGEVSVTNDRLKRAYPECDVWRRGALRQIVKISPALVVVASSVNYRRQVTGDRDTQDRLWRDGWSRTLDTLGAAADRVAVVADTPFFPSAVPECLARHPKRAGVCAQPVATVLREPAWRAVVADQVRGRGMSLIDPRPWLCSDVCPPVIGNVVVYRDTNHLTPVFAATMARLLDDSLPVPRRPG